MRRYGAQLKIDLVFDVEDSEDTTKYLEEQLMWAAHHLYDQGLLSGDVDSVTLASWMPFVKVAEEPTLTAT